jgi:phosphomannomutase
MEKINFGTDGWRAVIAREYTAENVARVSLACSNWLLRKFGEATVIIGYDTRFGGEMFAQTAAAILASKGIKVILSDRFTATPVVSLVVNMMKAEMGIMITASHNPPDYNGFKLKGSHGGPLFDEDVKDIENLINYENEIKPELIRIDSLIEKDILTIRNIESYYIQHVKENFDTDLFLENAKSLAFDPMFGSGQRILEEIIPGVKTIHNTRDVFFNNTSPEPLEKNLPDFLDFLKNDPVLKLGIAVDGDADRIALVDSGGNYIDSHHIILLLIHYLAGYKKQKGLVVTGFSSTVKVEILAAHYGLKVQRVKIGFKEISKYMIKDNVLVGGEESGGISIKGHIAERDGLWMGLTIWQWMLETGKSIEELINEIYSITGKFVFRRNDLHINKELKSRVIEKCLKGQFKSFGSYEVSRPDNLDGFKFYFDESSWLMIRPSGTEPVLRTYAEASNKETAADILKIAEEIIRNS